MTVFAITSMLLQLFHLSSVVDMYAAAAWVAAPVTVAGSKVSTSTNARSFQLSARQKRSSQLASSISAPPPGIVSNTPTNDNVGKSTSTSSSSQSPEVAATVKQAFQDSTSPIYLFDGVCNFCNDSVHLCYDLDSGAALRYASLQSPTGRALLQHFGKRPDDISSLVLVESADVAYFESDAVLKICQVLAGLPSAVRDAAALSQALVPERIRNAVYHVLSDNRHVFGATEGPTCRVDLDPARFVDDLLSNDEL